MYGFSYYTYNVLKKVEPLSELCSTVTIRGAILKQSIETETHMFYSHIMTISRTNNPIGSVFYVIDHQTQIFTSRLHTPLNFYKLFKFICHFPLFMNQPVKTNT